MIKKLIGAVAQSIRERLGAGYKVYTESVHQNLEKPCFFVECESAEKVPLLGRRFFLRMWVKISFLSSGDRKNYEEQEILGDLFLALNTIKTEEKSLMGRKIHAKRESGILTLRGCYDVFFEEAGENEDAALMEKIEGGLKVDG